MSLPIGTHKAKCLLFDLQMFRTKGFAKYLNKLDRDKLRVELLRLEQLLRDLRSCPLGGSKFKGVFLDTRRNKWRAHINLNGKKQWLGRYDSEEEAARAHDAKAIELFGIFADLNFRPRKVRRSRPHVADRVS